MKILVLGGLGYVGGRLTAFLKSEGFDITLAIRPNKEIPNWLAELQIETIQFDTKDTSTWERYIPQFDLLVNLIAANEIEAAENPLVALDHTAMTAYHLAKNLREDARLIQFSTFHVYGKSEGEIDESTCPQPAHPYGVAHLAAEGLIRAAAKGKQVIILRMGNAFGYPQDLQIASRWNLLVNDLCKQAVETKQMVLKSSGIQKRNFIPLAAVIETISQLMRSFPESGIYNLVSSHHPSILEMAELIKDRYQALYNKEIPVITPKAIEPETSPTNLKVNSRLAISNKADDLGIWKMEIEGLLHKLNFHIKSV